MIAFALPFAARCMTANASFICTSSFAAVILDAKTRAVCAGQRLVNIDQNSKPNSKQQTANSKP